MQMVPDELRKWVQVFERITSTTALILIVLFLIYNNTGDRTKATYAAQASAEEAVKVAREIKTAMDGHVKMASEDSSLMVMLLIQICINTAAGDRVIIAQCANYR